MTVHQHSRVSVPYCRAEAKPNDFATRAQLEYGKRIFENEVLPELRARVAETLSLPPRSEPCPRR